MFIIAKEFKFDAGHRVYTQQVNETLACNNLCVCRHLHGHEYKVEVYLENKNVNNQGMVTDFKHLNWFKKFLDDTFDHKFIFGIDDPFLGDLFNNIIMKNRIIVDIYNYRPLSSRKSLKTSKTFDDIYEFIKEEKFGVIEIVDIEDVPEHLHDIFHDGIVIVDFVPTAENLAKFFYEFIEEEMIKDLNHNPDRIMINKIRVWETSKSFAEYHK